jgi:hypothetical protein
MRARRLLSAGFCLASLASGVAAQSRAKDDGPLTLSGTMRLRYEAIDGQPRAGFNKSDDLFNMRTTLRAQYDTKPVTLVAELWDSRVYGGNRRTPVSTGEVNALELVQAYAEFRFKGTAGGGSNRKVQVGRFMLNLGSRRLVAADDYRNTTNGYTGLRADIDTKSGWQATAIYTLPQSRRPDDLDSLLDNEVALDRESFAQVLWGGLISRAKAIGPVTLETSYFHLGERDAPGRPTRDRSLDTLAIRAMRNPARAKLDYEVEAIGQRGQISSSLAANAPTQAVRSWFVHADAGYTFADPWRTRLSLEYDHASGDGRGGRYGRFDTLFGMRRADLAPAGLYNAIARINVVSPGVRLETNPDKRTDVMATYHPMWLASRFDSFSTTNVRDATGKSGNFAGHQIDARIRHKLSTKLSLEADAVLLAKGRFLRDAPNAPPGKLTKYLSLNVLGTF